MRGLRSSRNSAGLGGGLTNKPTNQPPQLQPATAIGVTLI